MTPAALVVAQDLVKLSVLVALALAAMPLLRGRSAALRHWVLSAAFVCAMLMPIVGLVVPAWQLSFAPHATPGVQPPAAVSTGARADRARRAAGPAVPAATTSGTSREWPAIDAVLLIVWAAGAAACASMLLVGLARLRRVVGHARPVTAPAWTDVLRELQSSFGIRRRVRLFESTDPAALVTWGAFRPTILVPAGAVGWTEDRIRVVIGHELAHVARGDWAVQIVAELVRASCWFNPLVWIACAELRRQSEQACDDAVLNLGIERTEYAAQLVELARACRARRRFLHQLSAPGMAQASTLEQRIRAMLNDHVNRRPLSRPARVLVAGALALVTIPIAGYGAQRFATVSGTILDSSNALLPGATLTLANAETRAKQEVHSDRTGHFEFVGLPAGTYTLAALLPGFTPFNEQMTLAPGQIVQRNVTLQVGQIEETLRVTEGDAETPSHGFKPVPPTAKTCGANTAAASGPPIGGQIKAPTKLADAHPVFPANLKGTNTSGVVVITAHIGTDGFVKDARVTRQVNPDFEQAAIDAVRQWQFSPTLLNCVPVEITMTATINFTGGTGASETASFTSRPRQ